MFCRKLGAMLGVGVPLLQALETILKETSDEPMKSMIADLSNSLKEGEDMKTAVARHPGVFSPSMLTMIEVGEATGTVDKVLLDIAKGIEDGTLSPAVSDAAVPGESAEGAVAPASNEEAPVIKVVALILTEAVTAGASDIHLESREGGQMRVRYRIDGVLHDMERLPARLQKAIVSRIRIMANMNLQEKRRPQDGRIMMNIKGRQIDIRVSIIPLIAGESVVMRLLDRAGVMLPELGAQGFTPHNQETLRSWCHKSNGVIIVTGPTGCGKTTTLYSLVHGLNSPDIKIMTVEDPVEYEIQGICQMPINPSLGITFAHALRAQLRQDPDVIMIGEIRDQETAYMAVQAALTGHLVLTTLHTSDAPEALRRLMDIGVEPFLVNSAVIGVVSQRLVRRICPDCRAEMAPPDWVQETLKGRTGIKSFRGKGCKACNQIGYRYRIGIHELLEMNQKVRAAVARDAGLEELRRAALDSGMITKSEDGLAKAAEGITTIEEVLSVCS